MTRRVGWKASVRPDHNPRRSALPPLRFHFDATQSCVWVDARSNLHPIRTETRGLEGWVEVALLPAGGLDLTHPVTGELSLAVDRLTSGNRLYDRELKRRIDARKYPTITGRITSFQETEVDGRYLVGGDLSFHGRTLYFEHEMTIDLGGASGIEMQGDYVFDIREFGMTPPSMLMMKVYPEVAVRVALYGNVSG